jgi:hypothetical protein
MTRTLTAIALATAALATPALAEDIDTVRAFYTDILSNPAETTSERYYDLFSPAVVSIPTPPGGEGAQGMLTFGDAASPKRTFRSDAKPAADPHYRHT